MLKIRSNGKQSRDIVVILTTNSDPAPLLAPLTHFVLSRLPRHHPAVYEYGSHSGWDLEREYQYRVVSGTSSIKDFEESGAFTVGHSVYLAIHLEKGSDPTAMQYMARTSDGILVDDTYLSTSNSLPLPADTVMRCLSINRCGRPSLARMLQGKWPGAVSNDVLDQIVRLLEPELVRNHVLSVGVSAVAPEYMAKLWREIVQSNELLGPTDWVQFNHKGLGYGRHPMMSLCAQGTAHDPLFCIDWRDELASHAHPAKTEEEAIRATGEEPLPYAWDTWVDQSQKFKGKAWDECRSPVS